jgi:NADH dehydrogenase (ubiquinone) Fe-S protein 3
MKRKFSVLLKKSTRGVIPLLGYQVFHDLEYTLLIRAKLTLLVLKILKYHINYKYSLLSCISCTDLMFSRYRFMISYELLSLTFNSRIRVKTFVNEYTLPTSAVSIFINANWWEREIWDLFGVFFESHPDLRRILTDYGFEGHPLRKDFPLFGFYEVRYDNTRKSMLHELVSFSQEQRSFYTTPAW